MRNNITGFVVGLNEGDLLKKSLPSLSTLDELIYVDLESTDNSIKIANEYNAKIIINERVPVVEIIHAKLLEKCSNDWVLLTDPDEVIDSTLLNQSLDIVNNIKVISNVGMILAPIQFYFNNKPLSGTIWGGSNYRVLLVNKNRIKFTASVHRGRQLKEGYTQYTIEREGNNIVHHYWMSSYKQLINKHLRYIEKEGESMYNSGNRPKLYKLLKTPFISFKECFLTKKGYKDGLIGFNLSLFWAWYKTSAYISLIKYSKSVSGSNL